MPETIFDELKRYVDFNAEDEAALRALHTSAARHFDEVAKVFYDRILGHEQARAVLEGGESQVGHLKVTLVAWMERLLLGPWDQTYFEVRCRIGRLHVRIALPQHYMFGAMNIVRQQFNELIDRYYLSQPEQLRRMRMAMGKILDLELAIMLHTYREDLLEEKARNERLATFGQLVGSIGHELRNPLGVIETSLFILKGRVQSDERAQKHVERIGEQLGIANGIVSALLDMIRDRPLALESIDLGRLLIEAWAGIRRPDTVHAVFDPPETWPKTRGDFNQLRQVFTNLLENASHAASPLGTIWVKWAQADGMVEVAIEDSGPGVDESVRRRLFEPLITTKPKGIGLGLALVKRIVTRHGGNISYSPRNGGGARFVVRLPMGG